MAEPIAEIIESSTRQFVAEVPREDEAPDFGAWVEVDHANGTTLYGLVSHVEHGSYDARRRAQALGMSTDELQREMPHVLDLLRTTLRAQVLAYRDAEGALRQTLPPQPAALHDFVCCCAPEMVRALGQPFDFLRALVRHPDPAVPVDDLLVALLRQLRSAHGAPDGSGEAAPVAAGRALSRLFDDDHERLHAVLRRVA